MKDCSRGIIVLKGRIIYRVLRCVLEGEASDGGEGWAVRKMVMKPHCTCTLIPYELHFMLRHESKNVVITGTN